MIDITYETFDFKILALPIGLPLDAFGRAIIEHTFHSASETDRKCMPEMHVWPQVMGVEIY